MNIEGKIPWFAGASRRKRWLVGVSGGMDSMALLHLLHEEGFRDVVVCHLNHGLRGAESAGDARLVKRVAGKMGFKVEMGKADVRGVMEEVGGSLETVARRARHEFFGECGRKHRCGSLLLAHHAGDQAETVLWNLMRGSHGCRGMQVSKEMKLGGRRMELVRPLLGVRKADLREWMESRKFPWREDATNVQNDVVRNRLRNEALPLLCEISGRDVTEMLVRAAAMGEDLRDLAGWAAEKSDAVDPQGRLHLKVFRSLPPALQTEVMAGFLKRHGVPGISADLLGRSVAVAELDGAASVNLPGGGRLRRRAGRIFVEGV
ncbi:MAG: tRNA lysidine(34) synthetase TilS [Akkermansiaceae bacterium]|nr:tRNA lysidine(34) synthetase TilS [Akkermansiaceae bacterium]